MTEREWLESANPWHLINFVGPGASSRKLRLFACACCRQVWNPFLPQFVIRVVEAAEAFADGDIGADALARVREFVAEAVVDANREDRRDGTGYLSRVLGACLSVCHSRSAAELAEDAAHATAMAAGDEPLSREARGFRASGLSPPAERSAEFAAQAELFRDVFGNPWNPRRVRPEWLTSTVLALARGIYADYAFDRMPILADALQDAGCDDDGILSHCREPREHARGCWVVDLLLGKR